MATAVPEPSSWDQRMRAGPSCGIAFEELGGTGQGQETARLQAEAELLGPEVGLEVELRCFITPHEGQGRGLALLDGAGPQGNALDAVLGRERGHISCGDDAGTDAPAGVDFEPAVGQ